MSRIEDKITLALNGAINQLTQEGIPVTPESQRQTILDWHTAWARVTSTPEDEELLTALELAADRLFCTQIGIQYH